MNLIPFAQAIRQHAWAAIADEKVQYNRGEINFDPFTIGSGMTKTRCDD